MTLREELVINLIWSWNNFPDDCRNAWLKHELGRDGDALDKLKETQDHNGHVKEVYESSYHAFGDFWQIVITASDVAPNFTEARTNIDWQFHNELDNLRKTDEKWTNGKRDEAIGSLLFDQKHNPHVMSLYRACYGNDPDRLFSIVHGYFV